MLLLRYLLFAVSLQFVLFTHRGANRLVIQLTANVHTDQS